MQFPRVFTLLAAALWLLTACHRDNSPQATQYEEERQTGEGAGATSPDPDGLDESAVSDEAAIEEPATEPYVRRSGVQPELQN